MLTTGIHGSILLYHDWYHASSPLTQYPWYIPNGTSSDCQKRPNLIGDDACHGSPSPRQPLQSGGTTAGEGTEGSVRFSGSCTGKYGPILMVHNEFDSVWFTNLTTSWFSWLRKSFLNQFPLENQPGSDKTIRLVCQRVELLGCSHPMPFRSSKLLGCSPICSMLGCDPAHQISIVISDISERSDGFRNQQPAWSRTNNLWFWL